MWHIFVHSGVILMLICNRIVFCGASVKNDTLVFVHIIYRHGDRNIASTYPNDPYKYESFWPSGYGQLTNIGKQEQYQLGSYLRKRYSKLIESDGSYNYKQIYVQSTDVDRTLNSAAYNLAGMFPPTGQQIWNASLMWQAIPIHTVPERMDHILAMKRPCPRYEKAYDEYMQSDEIKSIFKNNRKLIDYVEMHAGMRFKSILQLKVLYEVLWIENLKGIKLPLWTQEIFTPDGDLRKIADFSYQIDTKTELMAKLKAGFLIREMFERFAMKANATLSPDRSIFMYSAHDITIVNLMRTLNLVESQHLPTYSSCLFFEIHQINGTFHVEIFYKRDRGEDKVPLKPLIIPNCGQKCPLNKLNDIYRNVIPTEDFDTECRLAHSKSADDSDSSSIRQSPLLYLIVGFIVLLLIII